MMSQRFVGFYTRGSIMTAIKPERFISPFRILLGAVALGLLSIGIASAGAPQKADVFLFDGSGPVGEAMLVRTPNGVHTKIWTTGLDPSAVYTVWWVIFNYPQFCTDVIDGIDGCNGPDLFFSPGVAGCVIWATGHPIGPDGTGYFAASLNEGDTSGDQPFDPGTGPFDIPGCNGGLHDSEVAEIHVVLRTHGPIVPSLVYEQMGTYAGGCNGTPPFFDDVPPCGDQQFAVFLPLP